MSRLEATQGPGLSDRADVTSPRPRLAYKIRRPAWDPLEHPRDRRGRFIETGAHVTIWGGVTGTVVRNVGGGRLEVQRDSDGKRVVVHRNYLTVTERPDGDTPTADADAARAMPVQTPSATAVTDPDLATADPDLNDSDDAPAPVTPGAPAAGELGLFDDAGEDYLGLNLDPGRGGDKTVADVRRKIARGDTEPPEPERGHDTVEPTPVSYRFPSWKEEGAINSIEKANRRAARAGIDSRIGYTLTHEDVAETDELTGITTYQRYTTLTLDRPQVQHDGWTFAATLTWDEEAGLITRTAPGATLANRPQARHCDVCGSQRDRKDTYVVQNGDQELQVGSNCLQQFLGIRPAGLWLLEWEPEITDRDTDPDAGQGRGGGSSRAASEDLLALALAYTAENGYRSRAAAEGTGKIATVDAVQNILYGRSSGDEEARRIYLPRLEDHRDEARRVLDYARNEIDGDSDYVLNLRAAAGPDSVDPRNQALLVSAIGAYQRHLGQVAERKQREDAGQTSQHIGKPGEKIADQPATVTGVRVIDGFRGPTTLLTFVTPDGNVLKWFASGDKSSDHAIGDTVTVKATIKDHGEYRGVAETMITRAKLTDTGDAKTRKDTAREAAEAEERARQEVYEARQRRLRTAQPDGYRPVDEDETLPPGTVARLRVGNPADPTYRDVIITGHPRMQADFAGVERMVVPAEAADPLDTTYGAPPVADLVAVALEPDVDPDRVAAFIARQEKRETVPQGFTPGAPPEDDPLGPGDLVRVYAGGDYVTGIVTATDGDTMTVALPAGPHDTQRDRIRSFQRANR